MRKSKGITLIALVVTVIVLLILAGVSITAAIGDNDKAIISKARESAEQTEIAAKGEDGVVKEILNKIDDSSTTDKFTVTFIDGDNKVLATVTGQTGATIAYPSSAGTPTKTATAIAKYTFANKWATDPQGTNIVNLSSIKSSDRLYAVFNAEIEEGMISFTIDGITYYAEDAMCWDEWLESDYNTGGFKYNDLNSSGSSTGGITTGMNFYLATSDDKWIVDSITNEKVYIVWAMIEDGLVLVTQN